VQERRPPSPSALFVPGASRIAPASSRSFRRSAGSRPSARERVWSVRDPGDRESGPGVGLGQDARESTARSSDPRLASVAKAESSARSLAAARRRHALEQGLQSRPAVRVVGSCALILDGGVQRLHVPGGPRPPPAHPGAAPPARPRRRGPRGRPRSPGADLRRRVRLDPAQVADRRPSPLPRSPPRRDVGQGRGRAGLGEHVDAEDQQCGLRLRLVLALGEFQEERGRRGAGMVLQALDRHRAHLGCGLAGHLRGSLPESSARSAAGLPASEGPAAAPGSRARRRREADLAVPGVVAGVRPVELQRDVGGDPVDLPVARISSASDLRLEPPRGASRPLQALEHGQRRRPAAPGCGPGSRVPPWGSTPGRRSGAETPARERAPGPGPRGTALRSRMRSAPCITSPSDSRSRRRTGGVPPRRSARG